MFTMKSRPLMLCALFMACTAMSQPIARFLWTPVVRPFDYRPAYGTNAYNGDKNGSKDATGANGHNLVDPNVVKWNSLTSLIEFNATKTLTVGSESNQRQTRWNTSSTSKSSNPNLRLVTPTPNANPTEPKIQIYSAPQRRMIDDRNASESYLIYSSNPLVSPTVREEYYGYVITNVETIENIFNPTGLTLSNGARTHKEHHYYYRFTLTSKGRVGLEATKDFTIAGLPIAGGTPPIAHTGGFFGGPAVLPTLDAAAQACVGKSQEAINAGEMIQQIYKVAGADPNKFATHDSVSRAPVQGDSSSSLAQYTREDMYSNARFFGNFLISGGVVALNHGSQGQNSGQFDPTSDPTRTLSSVRNLNQNMQLGDLNKKLRLLSRLPQLGPDYLFLNVVNPQIGTPAVPNISQ